MKLISFIFHSYDAISSFWRPHPLFIYLSLLPCFSLVEGALEDRNARSAALEVSLREVLFQIIKFVNEKKDHVPPIPNLEGAISFPYEITIPR
jgi:hypothetical protein